MRNILLIIALALLTQLQSVRAEENICVRNQYLMSEKLSSLRSKAIDVIEQVSGDNFEVVDLQSQSGVFVVQESVDLRDGVNDADDAVILDKRSNVCEQFRKLRRLNRIDIHNTGIENLAGRRNFECECNGIIQISGTTPNDPYYSSHLWGLKDTNTQQGTYGINAYSAWDKTTGNSQTVVAVIDTGIDYNHPDLADNMWRNPGEIPGNGIDDDNNSKIDDYYGFNAITNSGNPMDDHGHGTHCAGTIGGKGNNSLGVAGVNWNIRIVGVKFLNSQGSGSWSDAIKAIDYVTDLKKRGIDVKLSNNSWGALDSYSSSLLAAIQRARDQGIIFVAAAGNDSNNNDSRASYPGNYNVDNIISVAAIQQNGTLASFSNYGATNVDIAAPGTSIASTVLNSGYSSWNGTSMAAPHVSGAIALLASWNPSLSWTELKNKTLQNTTYISSLSGKVSTSGMLNVNAMLNAAYAPGQTPIPTSTPTMTPTPLPSNTPTAIPSATATRTATPTPTPGWYKLTGTIKRTGDSLPLSGVQVTIKYGNSTYVAYTDAQGKYNIPNVPGPITYSVSASLSGYTFFDNSVYMSSDRVFDVIGLANAYTLSGKVIDNDKQPVAGVTINLNGGNLGSSNTMITDSQGNFQYSVPVNFNYTLTAQSDNFVFNFSELSGVIRGDTKRIFLVKDK